MIIEIFELILSAGPFIVFAGMGQNKDSGKLLFKRVVSNDSTVILNEDLTSITFSSNATGIAIPQNKIVYGTGTGITSSIFGVDTRPNFEAITGAGNIVGTTNSSNDNWSLPTTCNNLTVGGLNNKIYQTGAQSITDNVILSGKNLEIISNSSNVKENVIISGFSSSISDSYESVIISSYASKLSGSTSSRNSAIISSGFIDLQSSCNSTILSSASHSSTGVNLRQSTIISSTCLFNSDSLRSTVIASHNTQLSCKNNTILSSLGTNNSNPFKTIYFSSYSTMASTSDSFMIRSAYSSVLSSTSSNIYGTKFEPGALKIISNISDSGIFAGSENSIRAFSVNGTSSICSSSILAGRCNAIISLYNYKNLDRSIKASVIVGGEYNGILTLATTFSQPSYSIVVGGFGNGILGGPMNSILGGECNSIKESCNSSILGGTSSTICKAKHSVIIASSCSKIVRVGQPTFGSDPINSVISSSHCSNIDIDCNNQLIAGECNCIKYHGSFPNNINCNNVILAGCKNTLSGLNSLIIGGNQNCVCQNFASVNDSNSLIIGGKCNLMSGITTARDVIIGGYKNVIKDKTYDSVIIGGRYNNINAANSVTVGGCGLTNSSSDSAMFSNLLVRNLFFVNGVTGFSGTWTSTSPTTLCSRGGIITIY